MNNGKFIWCSICYFRIPRSILISAPSPLRKSLIGVPCSSIERNVEQGLTNVDFKSFLNRPTNRLLTLLNLWVYWSWTAEQALLLNATKPDHRTSPILSSTRYSKLTEVPLGKLEVTIKAPLVVQLGSSSQKNEGSTVPTSSSFKKNNNYSTSALSNSWLVAWLYQNTIFPSNSHEPSSSIASWS